jgi:isopentenyl diphosphate isomerase/L-lactate dehydrogenase-like FMN-dependent dehydrogenase
MGQDEKPTTVRPTLGAARQVEIYQGLLTGARISVPVRLEALEEKAREILSAEASEYVAGGAGAERTMRANLAAFDRWEIVPRMLRDVSQRDLSITMFGHRFPAPLMLAPVGVQGIVHGDAEVATARAAASLGIPLALSTLSSRSIEDVASAMGDTPRWFQLYWGNDSEITASMIQRAERAGYSALVITLDTKMLGWRERDLDLRHLPFLRGQGLANFFSDPVFRGRLQEPPERDLAAAVRMWLQVFPHLSLTWAHVEDLRKTTRLPLLLKGIVHADDARRALDAGVDGLIVSNHGGRQVDGAIGALDALPEVVDAVSGKVPVLFDSGIRRGVDGVKALALGAKAVLLGRPYVWGLAIAGEAGVRDVVQNFVADFDITMSLAGCAACRDLDLSLLRRV